MKPGRELDALVAEKVMGLKPFKKRWQEGCHSGLIDSWLDAEGTEIGSRLPPYSADIAAAWQVVERFPEYTIDRDADHGVVKVTLFDPATDRAGIAGAETAPHAICLAALKAVGNE